MHVPDGFLAPTTWIPAYAVSAGLWTWGARRARSALDVRALPQIGVLTAVAFVLNAVAIPIPGGTTVHFTGVALLALVFGVWPAFLAMSLVLGLQAVLLGAGGVTALPVSALALGFGGAIVTVLVHRSLCAWKPRVAVFVAAWTSVVIPALVLAVVLGLQARYAIGDDGRPLFFPFGVEVTLPAIVGPHLLVGIGEGVLTVFMVDAVRRLRGEST